MNCPLHCTMNLIGTKWKPLILFHLLEGGLRSGVLQKKIPGISNKMFTQTVRELEDILRPLDQWVLVHSN